MSENFDKEAERERLREKYESDSADREITERMSQLLLQGATMTNKHCDTCGSPIFRYQGQEFCPTCQAEVQGGEDATTEATETEPTAQAEAPESAGSTETTAESEPEQGDKSAQAPSEQAHESVGAASTGTAELGASQSTQPPADQRANPATGSSPTAVETSLSETIVTLSDRARTSEDPRQAKALLEAAREAAETLATLQGQ